MKCTQIEEEGKYKVNYLDQLMITGSSLLRKMRLIEFERELEIDEARVKMTLSQSLSSFEESMLN